MKTRVGRKPIPARAQERGYSIRSGSDTQMFRNDSPSRVGLGPNPRNRVRVDGLSSDEVTLESGPSPVGLVSLRRGDTWTQTCTQKKRRLRADRHRGKLRAKSVAVMQPQTKEPQRLPEAGKG